MAGIPWNRLTVAEHLQRGTYRRDRHGARAEAPASPTADSDRRRVLDGLGPEAQRLAAGLLDTYAGPWDAASLTTLRLWAQSGERLAVLTDDDERRRETRNYLALLRALELDQ